MAQGLLTCLVILLYLFSSAILYLLNLGNFLGFTLPVVIALSIFAGLTGMLVSFDTKNLLLGFVVNIFAFILLLMIVA